MIQIYQNMGTPALGHTQSWKERIKNIEQFSKCCKNSHSFEIEIIHTNQIDLGLL